MNRPFHPTCVCQVRFVHQYSLLIFAIQRTFPFTLPLGIKGQKERGPKCSKNIYIRMLLHFTQRFPYANSPAIFLPPQNLPQPIPLTLKTPPPPLPLSPQPPHSTPTPTRKRTHFPRLSPLHSDKISHYTQRADSFTKIGRTEGMSTVSLTAVRFWKSRYCATCHEQTLCVCV